MPNPIGTCCCTTAGVICCSCTVVPVQYSMSVTGVQNSNCVVCTNYNGSFVLVSVSGFSCAYEDALTSLTRCDGGPPNRFWQLNCDGTIWELNPVGLVLAQPAYTRPVVSWSCLGTNVMTQAEPSTGVQCSAWPANITVIAVP